SPATTAVVAGPPPLYGKWIIFVLVIVVISAIAMCEKLPPPDDAYRSCSGFARASATSSFTFFTGSDGWMARMPVCATMRLIGVKSRNVSYGSFGYVCGLLMWLAE